MIIYIYMNIIYQVFTKNYLLNHYNMKFIQFSGNVKAAIFKLSMTVRKFTVIRINNKNIRRNNSIIIINR